MADVFKELAQSDYKIIITTDHGSIRTTNPIKIIGDRNTNTNLRYKLGKSLNYDARQVFAIKNPHLAQLPAPNLSTSYVFATGDSFFAYPNNYNYYVSYYKDTFQHGGISMEEMIVPLATLSPRKRSRGSSPTPPKRGDFLNTLEWDREYILLKVSVLKT